MNKRILTIAILLIFSIIAVNAQIYTLSTFDGARKQLFTELKVSESKAHKLERSFDMLDKELLKLNNEIKGKTKSQVKGLVDKKYKKAEESIRTLLSPSEYKQVQALNSKQKSIITNSLTGKNGVFGKNGEKQTAIVVGTAIK